MGANKKVKNDYDLEIRNMMSNNADLTFDKFVEGLLRRMEAIKYSNLDSGSGVEEEVNAVNFRFGSDRGRSRGRGRGHWSWEWSPTPEWPWKRGILDQPLSSLQRELVSSRQVWLRKMRSSYLAKMSLLPRSPLGESVTCIPICSIDH
jgi:hypothetical protein